MFIQEINQWQCQLWSVFKTREQTLACFLTLVKTFFQINSFVIILIQPPRFSKGEKGERGEQGFKGDKGDQGLPGEATGPADAGAKGEDPTENGQHKNSSSLNTYRILTIMFSYVK